MPKTALPDARVSPRFAGISTFARYPRLEDVLAEDARTLGTRPSPLRVLAGSRWAVGQ